MDASRTTFVFDRVVSREELEARGLDELLDEAFPDLDDVQVLPRILLANMIVNDDPPSAWETVERLQAFGLDRTRTWAQLTMALVVVLERTSDDAPTAPFQELLEEQFALLPLPTFDEIDAAIRTTVGRRADLGIDDLREAVRHELGFGEGDSADTFVTRLLDDLVEAGELTLIGDDIVVDPIQLVADSVFTHRLTAAERASGVLHLGVDLGVFGGADHVHLDRIGEQGLTEAAETVDSFDDLGFEIAAWEGPDGWLDDHPVGSLLAVRVEPAALGDCDNKLVLDALEESALQPDDGSFAEVLRDAVARESEVSELPVPVDALVCAVVAASPEAFAQPRRPLAERCAEAGLDVRGGRIGREASHWYHLAASQRIGRLLAMSEAWELVKQAVEVLTILDIAAGTDPSWPVAFEGAVDDDRLHTVLHDLGAPELLTLVAQEVFADPPPVLDEPGMPGTPSSAEAIVAALTGVAESGRERVIARWFAAIAAERAGDPEAAEQHLEIAHSADPSNPLPVDRLAWCAFDRGDVDRADQLWSRLSQTDTIRADRRVLAEARRLRAPQPGRNEPCWCGSGRKYKQCHNGQASLPPLPDRVGWLCRKASTFLERRGGAAAETVLAIARTRALDPDDDDSLAQAFADPIVVDLALTEGGWFERFLDERGALLPDDEQLLARSWTLVDRSVFEVLDVRRGEGMTLRDLRSGDEVVVREQELSSQVSVGMMCCARVVPDGTSHQFVGGIFGVRTGEEARVLDLCDAGDPLAIARWVADSHRPPTLTNREGDAMVQCRAVLSVRDAAAARRVLDRFFDPDDSPTGAPDRWIELVDVDGRGDEFIVRAHLRLEGDEIHVETNSERRMDLVLELVQSKLKAAQLVHEERTPIDTAKYLKDARKTATGSGPIGLNRPDPDDSTTAAAMAQVRDRYEERWCDEPVPALGGVTPREAAADPTRRESLERLIRSFEAMPDLGGAGSFGMRPARLRALLGLDA
jgi:hypothetical protein